MTSKMPDTIVKYKIYFDMSCDCISKIVFFVSDECISMQWWINYVALRAKNIIPKLVVNFTINIRCCNIGDVGGGLSAGGGETLNQQLLAGMQQCFSQLHLHSLEIQALSKHLQVRRPYLFYPAAQWFPFQPYQWGAAHLFGSLGRLWSIPSCTSTVAMWCVL